jgi:hypothetical protein
VIVIGGVGLFFGVIADDAFPALDVPTSFVTVVAKVYATPSLNPVRVQDVAGGVIKHVNPPGDDVTV